MRSFQFPQLARRAICVAAVSLLMPSAWAWTDKPVRLLVPAPAGGTMDVIARLISDQLSADIGQPVVIDNKPGAGGGIAVQALRAAPADGQTLMMTASNVLTEIPHVLKGGFDPIKDIKPVTALARSTILFVANPGLGVKDVKGFIAYAKANPGKLSFASYSAGTSSHYAGMIFNQKAGLDMQHVPFPGSPPALTQVMGGHIAVMFDGLVTSKPLVAGGKVTALGLAASKRSPQLPDVPTMAEQGFPEFNFSNWVGVVASSGLSNDMADKIHKAVSKAAATQKVRERMIAAGFEPVEDQTSAQLTQAVKAEFDRNAAIVKQFNIQVNQ